MACSDERCLGNPQEVTVRGQINSGFESDLDKWLSFGNWINKGPAAPIVHSSVHFNHSFLLLEIITKNLNIMGCRGRPDTKIEETKSQ